MRLHNIEIDDSKLAEFCKQNGVAELIFFGSVTRHNFRPSSDVDIAIKYQQNASVSLFDFAGHELELTNLVGRPVHLTELSTIPTTAIDRVVTGAIRAYAA